jgi:hypothetical protein
MANRYSNIRTTKSEDGKIIRRTVVYPEIPLSEEDIYVITTFGDRYDLLAKNFYGDSKFWWIIASANNATSDSLFLEPGVQIRIPTDRVNIVNQFEQHNLIR